MCECVKSCHKCQLHKPQRKKHAKMPLKVAETAVPWNRVDIDSIGPWSVHTADEKTHKVRALTMINPATGWFEIAESDEINAKTCADAFDDAWLIRCPRPQQLGCDNGSEFKEVFKEMRVTCRLDKHNSTVANLQSIRVTEQAHQGMVDVIRTFGLEE